jgi:hypothetical protein
MNKVREMRKLTRGNSGTALTHWQGLHNLSSGRGRLNDGDAHGAHPEIWKEKFFFEKNIGARLNAFPALTWPGRGRRGPRGHRSQRPHRVRRDRHGDELHGTAGLQNGRKLFRGSNGVGDPFDLTWGPESRTPCAPCATGLGDLRNAETGDRPLRRVEAAVIRGDVSCREKIS